MRKEAALGLTVIFIFAVSMSATVYADASYSIFIMDPTNSSNGGKGISSSGYWVGQIPIQITSGTTTSQAQAYCMQAERIIYIGSTYTATLTPTPDSANWKAISYILSWYNPTDSTTAAVNQVAIWKLLNPSYQRESWLDQTIYNSGIALATLATDKNVARQGDVFKWISPITTSGASISGSIGQIITYKAQLTDSAGNPRANVKIQWTGIITGGAHIYMNTTYLPSESFTDANGYAQVNVKVPAGLLNGVSIEIDAKTQSVWPQRFVDLTSADNQDLIGVGSTFDLSVSTNIWILGYIHVVPESALGALSALTAAAAAFIIWTRMKKQKGPMNPMKN